MATGDTFVTFMARHAEPADVTAATIDTRGGTVVLDFSDTSVETTEFAGVMPGQYDGATSIVVSFGWMATDTTVTPDTVVWSIAWKRLQDDVDDVDSVAFATAVTATVTEASNSGEIAYDAITFTNAQADGIQPNETFRLKIQRHPADGGDVLVNDAELVFVEIQSA